MNNENILKEQGQPLTGTPRYTPGASGFGLRDSQGNATGDTWYSIETPTPSAEDQTARIGDYVLQKGTPVVVPNSPTDLSQKYKIAIGGSGLTSQEAVAQSVDAPSIAGGAAGGAAIGSMFGPAGALIGGLAGALNAYNTNAEDALKKWQEENIKYDTAVEFYRDDAGKLNYKLDYSKMGTGGPRSGEGIKEAQTRETQVSLGDDGRLKVTVSPIFASTARFQELVNWISENYAGLTKDTENYEQILEEIKNGIDGEAQSYVTNMRLYADYANRFPDASPEAIVAAYMTEVSGYIDPEKMGDFSMSVIGTSGIETKTAKDFFDSVLNMSIDDKNRLLERLNDIVYGDNDYGANEKAVAFGELRALYTVSNNPEKYENDEYQGMLDADFFVTLMSNFSPLGLNAGDVLHFVSGGNLIQTKQEFLNQNDFARFVGTVGSVGAGFGLFKGATALIEKGMKLLPGTSQLFRASLEGSGATSGGVIANLAQMTGDTKAVIKAASASAAFKTIKVGVFDAALAGSKTLVSGTDFWSEFGQDLARDAILEAVFSYYDAVQFQKAVNDSTVLVVRDPKTGNVSKLPITEAQEAFDDSLEVVGAYNLQQTRAGEETGIVQSEYGTTLYYNGTAVTVSPTGEVQKMLAAPEGMSDGIPVLKTGVAEEADVTTTDLTTVEQTLERMGLPKDAEVFAIPSQSAAAAEVAGKIAKLDTTKAGLAINTNLFNKNAALDTVNEIALAKTGDLTAWQNRSQKFVSVLDNANQEINLMRTGSYVKNSEQAFNDYQMSLGALNLTQKYKKTDADFLKAITQLERAAYLDRHKVEGDTRNYTAEALEKYGDAIAKVPDDRAAVLRDFNEKRKARHDATKASARKSGKIDIKKLDSFTDSDLQKEIGWVPQWGKKQTYNGLLSKFYGISQERNFYKEWLPEGGWVDLDKLEDPIKADERFLNFVATNMGITDMIENTASALDDARMLVDNTPSSETIRKRKLDSIKNKDELIKKFSDMVAEKKKEIREKVPNQKQYKELMQKNIEESGVLEAIEDAITDGMTMQAVIGTSEVLLDKLNGYNKLFSYDFDIESYMNTEYLPNLKEALNAKDMGLAATIVNQATLDVAPYRSQSSLLKSAQESVAEKWRKWAEKNVQKEKGAPRTTKKELVDLVAAEINGETTDAYEMGAATRAVGMDGRYPITWYRKGKPYTRFITYRNKEEQRLAEAITELFTDKQLIKQPGVVSRVASFVANDFRLLTTGFDPTRAPLNFARDTGRGQITSGGQSFINPQRIFNSLLETGSYTAAEKEKLSKALDNVVQMVAGETYNAAYRSGRNTATQATKQYLSKTGANPLRRFTYSLIHDKRSIAEAPADFFEGLTRKRLAKSAAVVKLRQLQKDGASLKEQLQGMVDSAFFAGREYTANFARKGKLIEQTSKYVAYQSSAYAGLDGMKRAFINNPEGVSKNFAVFLIAYLILLADTLGDEDSRKNYYRLSEYDRGNSLVISLGDDTVLTIPLDQEVAAFLFPYRRFMETLNGVDPVSFFEFVWGTLTEPLPMDLSGFSEGEGFNLVRGLQKLTSQNMPNVMTGIQEASTGYDLYYGTDIRVTDETLKDYGIYNPEAGDYTTAGNNSALLRQVANITGIPQWQLQAMVNNYGGNVGQYVLNVLDKLGGASEDAQGGKDFANAIFKSFVATDQDAAEREFYNGIQQLQGEKRKLIQKIADYNEDVKTASGDAKVELQIKLQQAKDEYAVKVADFVDKYVSAYEITGGLPKSQAMQVYYLFRLDDDDTVYESGSPEEYYNNQTVQKFKNQATAMSAPILDRYYNNRIGNVYQDAEGNWRRYLSSGMQAMRNTIYGQGEEHMVGLLNILEGKDSNLKALRTRIKNARNEAYNAKDWTTRNALGYELDKAVVDAISPYIEKYGAENVLGNNEVLDYLSDWFIVPDDFIKPKRGKYVSLANSGSTQEAFVRPYIKYVFGLPTNYYSYSDTSLTSPSLGDFGR